MGNGLVFISLACSTSFVGWTVWLMVLAVRTIQRCSSIRVSVIFRRTNQPPLQEKIGPHTSSILAPSVLILISCLVTRGSLVAAETLLTGDWLVSVLQDQVVEWLDDERASARVATSRELNGKRRRHSQLTEQQQCKQPHTLLFYKTYINDITVKIVSAKGIL